MKVNMRIDNISSTVITGLLSLTATATALLINDLNGFVPALRAVYSLTLGCVHCSLHNWISIVILVLL